jgi:streptogramin lyase
MTTLSRFLLLLIPGNVICLTGCAEPRDPVRHAVIDTLESGVVSVHNVDTELAQTWHIEHVSRIGSVAGDGPDVFGSIGSLTVDPLGRIWVYDRHAKELRLFDREGSHVRTVGRAGQGPGEFNEVVGLLWSPEGHLWTVDQRAARVSIFDTAGTFLTSRPLGGTSFYARWPGIVDQHGYFYNIARDFTTGRTALIRLDSVFRAVDSIAVPPHPNGPGSVCKSQGRGSACTSIPYAGSVQWVMTPDGGLWAALTDMYHLVRLGPSGDTLRIVSKAFDPGDLLWYMTVSL